MFFETQFGHELPHDPIKAIVAPRPIGWVSTVDAHGIVNLAPYSFSNLVSEDPPLFGFSSNGLKDSVRNAQETGEFVFNLATRQLASAMRRTSEAVPSEVDEFVLSGLTPLPSKLVAPPYVCESPAALECKVTQSFELFDASGKKGGHWLTIGEVVAVHIDDRYLHDGRFDLAAAGTIARCGYRDFVEVSEVFQIT